MSTGIPYGGAARRWHDNPLQEEVDRLRAALEVIMASHEADKDYYMEDYAESMLKAVEQAKQILDTKD
jgi:hypothetical protein